MIKLAILGIDNSHAWSFSECLAGKDGSKIFDDVELIGLYGDYSTNDGKIAVEQIKKRSSCDLFANHYNDFVDIADAVMVTARFGGFHFEYAKEYIKKGIPVWIDKPITCSSDEVYEMIKLAEKYNCPISGGSSMPYLPQMKKIAEKAKSIDGGILGGHVTAPVIMVNPYGNFWFYTPHLVQMITSVFGTDIRSVRAIEGKNGVTAIYFYDDYIVTAYFGTDYTVTVYTKEEEVIQERIVIDEKFYIPELKAFYEVIKSKKSDITYKELAAPVYIIEATIKSFKEKQEVKILMPF